MRPDDDDACDLAVHEALYAAWKRARTAKRHDNGYHKSGHVPNADVPPWVFPTRSDTSDQAVRSSKSQGRPACFCIGYAVTTPMPSRYDSALTIVGLREAVVHTRELVQENVTDEVQGIITRTEERREGGGHAPPPPSIIDLTWQESPSEPLPLMIITSWKREVERQLPETVFPSLRHFVRLIPSSIQRLRQSPFFDTVFWNKGTQLDPSRMGRDAILALLIDMEQRAEATCEAYLRTEEATSSHAFQTIGDFMMFVRHTVRGVVDTIVGEEGRTVQFMLPRPLWLEADAVSNPPWKSLPFPPQCYGGWSTYHPPEPQSVFARAHPASYGTPPRRRETMPPLGISSTERFALSPSTAPTSFPPEALFAEATVSPLVRSRCRVAAAAQRTTAAGGSASGCKRSGGDGRTRHSNTKIFMFRNPNGRVLRPTSPP